MSIFRESLRDFIQKQIKIRETAIDAGSIFSRNNPTQIEDNKVTAGAHYTYRQKSCTIRMSSLVDIMKDINLDLGVNNRDGTRSQVQFEDYKGSTLARNFILQGGVLSDYTTNLPIDPPVDPADNMGPFLPGEEPSNSRPTSKTIRAKVRGGFPSRKRINLAYGDPTTASEPLGGDDGYGVVPMPGIVDMRIKTDSYYGSLRRAKVNFRCHNLRQLEILELLYMRPGYPVLLEWGWLPYLDNNGNRVDNFTSLSDLDGFWDDQTVTQASLEQDIVQLKEATFGNYDAFVGFVSNFNYESRSDGGFDCSIETISLGEVLDSLKIPNVEVSVLSSEIYNELDENDIALDEIINEAKPNLKKTLPKIAARNVERNNNINFDIESMMDMVGEAGKGENSEEAKILFKASNASSDLEQALVDLQVYFEDDLGEGKKEE